MIFIASNTIIDVMWIRFTYSRVKSFNNTKKKALTPNSHILLNRLAILCFCISATVNEYKIASQKIKTVDR